MKKFNVTVETQTNAHCFSFEAVNMQSALTRLKALKLNCTQITELRENYSGTIRIPEDMYK